MKYTAVVLALAATVLALPKADPETINSRVGLSDICYGCKREAQPAPSPVETVNARVGLSDICYGCKREAIEAIEDIIAREAARPSAETQNKRVGLDDKCYIC